jgi:ABC-type dipeptide/oligopeptide/nickel transport system permease component
MPPILSFIISRIMATLLTLIVITMVLYGFVMLTPPETRATLYMPNTNRFLTDEQYERLIELIIVRRHLRDPYPIQYAIWASELVQGRWGYSPALNEDVLPVMLRRSPVTAELTLYSLLVFIPLGLISGMTAGSRKGRGADHRFRLAAFIAGAMPPFILALLLLSVFYVGLHWFPPERLGIQNGLLVKSAEFRSYTGLLTLDGLLNGRLDISLDALRHLVLPVLTLSLVHWATLGRVTRAVSIEELEKEYILAGKARGISNQALVWKHAFRNTLAPSLTSSALSAAALFTGVFVVEVIFNFKGISEIAVSSINQTPDAPAVLGFAIYCVLVVLAIMLVLDILQAFIDPRIREGFTNR